MHTFKLVEGYDHFKKKPLYQCSGINNDYVGEWHDNKIHAQMEVESLELSHDIKLNNGLTAVFVMIDYWHRPQYDIEFNGRKIRVCCTELNGTHLHTMSSDHEEPISPLKPEFQPVPRW